MKKKLLLLSILLLTACSSNKQVEIIARYENVLYNISKETGELTVVYNYIEKDNVVYGGSEYRTTNYTYARYLTFDNELSNVFFIRKNASDLLIAYYK